jgi:DNA-binding NtrC family response regulator
MLKRILIIDDEVAFLISIEKLLQKGGHIIDTAETLEEALSFINMNNYDAVLADVRLGGSLNSEGLEILEAVKKRDSNSKVIIMTGYGNPEVMARAYDLKADYYFEKPVSIGSLIDALEEKGRESE